MRLSRLVFLALVAVPGVTGFGMEPAAPPPVLTMTISGPVDPAVKNHLLDGFRRAETLNAGAVVLRLDTPGGLLDATRDIVQAMINAPCPVIVHVAPRGARAASAGVFLTMAADVAVLAPETHLGAAHPVNLGGGAPGSEAPASSTGSANILGEKAVSDAAAYIRGLAVAHGRNAVWAEDAVRRSVSLTAEEALANHVVDLIAADETELMDRLEGREVRKNGRTFTLRFRGAARIDHPMSAAQRGLHVLGHPNIAYLLLVLGFYALVYEFATPGVGLGGIAGITCLVLAFFSLQILPINTAGLVLLVAGLAMMAVDLIVSSHGLLIFGGLLAFGLGSFLLFDGDSPAGRVSWPLIVGTLAGSAAYFGLALRKVFQARRAPPRTGAESLRGQSAEVRPGGLVFVQGALWTADGLEGFKPGDRAIVLEVLGTRLRVGRPS